MLYLILKYLHILSAIVAIGASSTYAVWLAQTRMKPEALLFTLRTIIFIDLRVASSAYLLLIITGIGLGHAAAIPLLSPWLILSYILLGLLLSLDHAFLIPLSKKSIALIEGGQHGSEAHLVIGKKMSTAGMGFMFISLAIVWLMVFKPMF
jgi:uncharacterized membrane protein